MIKEINRFILKYALFWVVLSTALYILAPKFFTLIFPAMGNWKHLLTFINYKFILASIGGIVLTMALELWLVGYDRSALKKLRNPSPSMKRDIVMSVLYLSGLKRLIGYTLLFGLPFVLGAYFAAEPYIRVLDYIPTTLGKAIAALLLMSFFEYWAHRLFHEVNALWELHKYHHSSTEMSIFAAHRDNPLSGAIIGIIGAIPVIYLGATLDSLVVVALFRIVLDCVIHSEIDHGFGWIGRWIIVSPRTHRAHHTEFNKNYGFFIIFWDRVFGTYAPGTGKGRLDAEDPVYNKDNIWHEMWYGYYMFFKEASKSIRRILKAVPLKKRTP